MREIRQSGSEGGGTETNRPSLPLYNSLKTLDSRFRENDTKGFMRGFSANC
jgi:hypothetical protein